MVFIRETPKRTWRSFGGEPPFMETPMGVLPSNIEKKIWFYGETWIKTQITWFYPEHGEVTVNINGFDREKQ